MSFQIYFKDEIHERERIKVSVSNSEEEFKNTTVEELKRKLIPEDQFDDATLLYKDVELEDDHTLGSYGIKHEDEIIVIKIMPRYLYSRTTEDSPADEDKGVPRSESMEKLANMQQEESSGWCCIM